MNVILETIAGLVFLVAVGVLMAYFRWQVTAAYYDRINKDEN
jgi:hypothetical protein